MQFLEENKVQKVDHRKDYGGGPVKDRSEGEPGRREVSWKAMAVSEPWRSCRPSPRTMDIE